MPAKADTFSVRLPEETRHRVDEIARRLRRSRSFIVKEAVEQYVRDHARYLDELDAALASVETEGGHSSESIFRWMRSWGSETELPPPEPDVAPLK
ncbi:MAG: ribbon-helix-helix protein, CopG family [Rhodoblastus sp.]|nr:ribbon-helix-helix protein, CopG family [Rhodoblastus sp.]